MNISDIDILKNSYESSSVSFLIDPSSNDSSSTPIQDDELSITKLECVLCNEAFDSVSVFMQHVNSHESVNFTAKLEETQEQSVVTSSKTIFPCLWRDKNLWSSFSSEITITSTSSVSNESSIIF